MNEVMVFEKEVNRAVILNKVGRGSLRVGKMILGHSPQ